MGKKLLIIIILLGILIAGIFFYKQKFNHWPWQVRSVNDEEGQKKESLFDKWLTKKTEGLEREPVMEYVSNNIIDLSPEKSVLGGQWHVNRFWFVFGSDKDFYVEYEDGHIMRKILMKVEDGKYKVVGFFEPGEDDWVLKSGDDLQFGKPLELYEFNRNQNKWIRK